MSAIAAVSPSGGEIAARRALHARQSGPAETEPQEATRRGVYNALGERKHCSAADCVVADEIAAVLPGGRAATRALATMLIAFARRAGRVMVTAGIDQFLIGGVDLCLGEPLHRFLWRCAGPGETPPMVVYLDDDPAAVAAARSSFGLRDSTTHAALVDLRDPCIAIQASVSPETDSSERGYVTARARHRAVDEVLDFTQPIGLIQCGPLPHLAGDVNSAGAPRVMRDWCSVLPDESFVALTHFCLPAPTSPLAVVAAQLERVFSASPLGAGDFLPPEQIVKLFGGYDLLPPNTGTGREVVPVADWWPEGPLLDPVAAAIAPLLWGGVASKGSAFGLCSHKHLRGA